MGKILVSSSHWKTLCTEAEKLLLNAGHEVIVYQGELPYMSFEEISAVAGDIDGAIVGMDNWTEAVYQLAPKLKVIARFGVGTDNVDKESAKKHGIKVTNAAGINANAVAELAVGLILDMLRKITALHTAITDGVWMRHLGAELEGRTVGLVGFGAIAKLVAKKLQGFDVNVIACDLYPDLEAAKQYNVKITSMDEVICQSDIVSIHIPCVPETTHLFDDTVFSKMKKGAYLVNTARGAIVDTAALIRALESGQIAMAALDAFENEPLSANDPLVRSGKVICTPHTGAETKETYRKVSLCAAQCVVDVLSGRIPKNWLNP